jgi:sec-independent protein translocase protein TatB
VPDIGFWELCIIAVVALIVLGPERLPTAARTTGRWINKARRMVNSVKAEIDRELQLDEVNQRLKEQQQQIEQGLRDATNADDLERQTSDAMNEQMLADIQGTSTPPAKPKKTDE